MPDPSYKQADGGVKLRDKAWSDVIAWRSSGPLRDRPGLSQFL